MENQNNFNKRISRRDFLRLASAGVGAVALASCAPQVVATEPPKPTGERAYLRFLTQETDPKEVAVYRKMIEDFETQNPDIRIEMDVTGPEQIIARMVAALAAGATTVDVLQPNPAMGYLLTVQGLVLPIDDIVEKVGGESFFYDNSVMKYEGKAYGVPFGGGTGVIWYRKDLFEQDGISVPTTWEEFAEVAKHFTKKSNPNSPTDFGVCLSYNRHQSVDLFMDPFWWSNGGECFDKDLNIAFDSPETEEFLEWYVSMREFSPEGSTGYAWGDFINTFLTGQTAMSFYLGRMLGRAYSNAPELIGKIGVFNYPVRKLRVTSDDPNYYIINANTAYPEQAKRWVEFTLTSKWANEFLCAIPSHLPPATKNQVEWWNQDVTGCMELDENKDIKKAIGDLVDIAYNPISNSGGILEAVKQGKDKYVSTGVWNPFVASVQNENAFMPLALQLMAVEGKTARQAIDEVLPQMEAAVKQTMTDVKWGD